MKNLTLIPLLLTLLIACDNKDRTDRALGCNELRSALLSYDDETVKNEISATLDMLLPRSSENDELGHQDNIRIVVDKINECPYMTAETYCYACIKTLPPQSEILVSIDSAGQVVKRIMDIFTPAGNSLSFRNVHEFSGGDE